MPDGTMNCDRVSPMSREAIDINAILGDARTIAVVGASPNPARPSHMVARYLMDNGYRVIPVRPRVSEILGQRCYEQLKDIPVPVDIVDVFRKPEACPAVARSAVAIGARILWLQEGIISEEAAAIASAGGLAVIMDYCIMVAHKKSHHLMDRD